METITRDVSDLDKFKRRLIRTVARLLLQEKRPEKEVWTCLKKETNYECKVLWSRMRALTLKKLDRLFQSNDNVGRVPKAARMSLTDWLLFDMVLVHQNVDVIKMHELKKDPKPLVDLVELVKKFDIEGKRNEDLALAWSSATLYYNSLGHQCSPMLLQLRWYQLKRATRDQFYKFWFAYRGVVKRLSMAESVMPTPLQVEIARSYKHLVTLTFLEWEEMIEKGEVILPEMLANKMCEKSEAIRKPTFSEERTPDLEVIEPEIETIDLGVDSDSEDDAKKSDTEPKSPVEPVKIKEEPLDIDIDGPHVEEPRKQHWFDEALQHTAVEHDNLDNMPEDVDSTDDLAVEENEITQAIEHTLNQQKESMLPQITCVFGNVDESNGILSQIDALGATINNPPVIDAIEDTEQNITTHIESPENNDTIESENTEQSVDMNIINLDEEEMPSVSSEIVPENEASGNVALENVVLEKVAQEKVVLENESSEVKAEIKPEVNSEEVKFTFGELSNDMSFADDGIAFVDDGIAYNDDYDNTTESNKEEEKVNDDGEPKIDPKLLMLPITYTTKLDDMGLKYFQQIRDKQLIEIICKNSKPVMKTAATEETQVIEDESLTDEESIVIPDDQKVKPSSYLLQKPRTRTYHPIQLCKNPDFNTRLKRLTVGFLSSPRNRGLLKACKPLTIDLTKAFEYKLRDGTLYLKATDSATVSKDTEVMSRQNVSVMPSAMPAQSLIDNTKPVEIFPSASNYDASKPSDNSNERKKVINLQDISEIRRINQTLLTAEVSPIQVQNKTPQVQVSIVSPPQNTGNVILEKRLLSNTVNFPPSVVDMTKNDNKYRNVKPLQLKQKLIAERYQDLLTLKHPRSGPRLPSYKPKQFKPRIPWLSKTAELCTPGSASKEDEALLTVDTLNKMLFLFVNENEHEVGSSQKKPKNKKKRKVTTDKTNDTPIVSDTDGSSNKNKTPRFNIKPGDNDPRKKGKPIEKCRESEQADDEQSSRNCCCWAQRRILYMMGTIKVSPLHDCEYPICTCCCKNLLEEYTVNDHLQKRAELKRRRTLQTDDFTKNNDSKSNNGNYAPTAENTIEIRDDSPEPQEDPRKKGKIVICCPKETVEFPKQKQATEPKPVEIVDKTPEVTVISDSPVNSVDAAIQTTKSDGKTDTVINLEGLNDEPPTVVDEDEPVTSKAKSAESSKVLTSGRDSSVFTQISKSAVTTLSKNVVSTVNTPSKPSRIKNKKTKTLRKAPAPITPPKNVPEKFIYLNSNQISPKPTENPIFLEKNKILLTTVKFPHNLYKFEEAKQVLKSYLKLPEGVNLVLLTDGTVTYAVSPYVEVRATDMAAVPGVVAAVQQYINTSCIAPEPVARISIKIDSQVVNLTDDDDTSAVNTIKSSSTISVVPEAVGQTVNEETIKSRDVTANLGHAETSAKSNDYPQDVADVSAETHKVQLIINEKISQENISETPTTAVEVPPIETGENTGTATKNNLENDQETINEKTSQENATEKTDDESKKSSLPTENNLNDDQQTINKENSPQSIPETAKTTAAEKPLEKEITNSNSKNILSDLMEMSGIFDEDVTTQPPADPASVTQNTIEPTNFKPGQPPLKQIADEPLTPLSVKGIINELSPITSLCELRYACLNNGLFFKLDFETRLLVPIKVCMKPHTNIPKLPNSTGPPKIIVKSVIDLTKDEDAQPVDVVPTRIEAPIKVTSGPAILGGKTSKTAKPIKVYKILSAPMIANLRASNATKNEDSDSDPRSILRKYNRKQCLKQNVLLYDNDCIQLKKKTIVSEQFLHKINPAQTLIMSNTRDDDSNVTINIDFDKSQANDSDSSDEEPLAIKAKRKRANMDSPAIENKTVPETAAQEEGVDEPDDYEPMDVDDPHEMEPEFEIFPTDENDEDSEENCILGF